MYVCIHTYGVIKHISTIREVHPYFIQHCSPHVTAMTCSRDIRPPAHLRLPVPHCSRIATDSHVNQWGGWAPTLARHAVGAPSHPALRNFTTNNSFTPQLMPNFRPSLFVRTFSFRFPYYPLWRTCTRDEDAPLAATRSKHL